MHEIDEEDIPNFARVANKPSISTGGIKPGQHLKLPNFVTGVKKATSVSNQGMRLKKIHTIFFAFLLLLVLVTSGCIKEYSYEGGIVSPPIVDSSRPPVNPTTGVDLPECSFCNSDRDDYVERRWSFKVGDTLQCGTMDTAILTPGRDAFTFFGPSSCSPITSMVMTVYLDNIILNKDQRDLVLTKVVFAYHTLGLPKYLLSTQRGSLFYLTIANYDHQTKMTTGTFNGEVLSADGTFLQVNSGKFKVKLI